MFIGNTSAHHFLDLHTPQPDKNPKFGAVSIYWHPYLSNFAVACCSTFFALLAQLEFKNNTRACEVFLKVTHVTTTRKKLVNAYNKKHLKRNHEVAGSSPVWGKFFREREEEKKGKEK